MMNVCIVIINRGSNSCGNILCVPVHTARDICKCRLFCCLLDLNIFKVSFSSRAHRSSISAIVSLKVSIYFCFMLLNFSHLKIPANECENEGIVIVFDMNYSQFRPFSFSVCLPMGLVYFNPQSFGISV